MPPVLGNWFAVIAGSPEFIAQSTAETCLRWTRRQMERKKRKERGEKSERTHGGQETKDLAWAGIMGT